MIAPRPNFLRHTQRSRIQNLSAFGLEQKSKRPPLPEVMQNSMMLKDIYNCRATTKGLDFIYVYKKENKFVQKQL